MSWITRTIQCIAALWQIAKWLDAQKKALDTNADVYLSDERAAAWRLWLERMFYALEHGNGNLTMLPKPVRWLFSQTTADNRVGQFGLRLLKSEKLRTNDPAIQVYPCH